MKPACSDFSVVGLIEVTNVSLTAFVEFNTTQSGLLRFRLVCGDFMRG